MSESFNGWCNYETWAVGVVLANDESAYIETQLVVDGAPHPGAALKEWCQEHAEYYDWDLGPVDFLEVLESVLNE